MDAVSYANNDKKGVTSAEGPGAAETDLKVLINGTGFIPPSRPLSLMAPSLEKKTPTHIFSYRCSSNFSLGKK